MHSLTAFPDSDWSTPSVRTSVATPEVRAPRHASRTVSEKESSYIARVQRRALGRVIAFVGSCNILLGMLLADQHRSARGHRQRVVGMLQLNCEVDRRTADEFIDRWLSKRPIAEA